MEHEDNGLEAGSALASARTNQKPKMPYPGYPLTPHPNGQWCKIRGKVHFFGVWDDHDTALELYHQQAADLHTGRQPTVSTDELTVKDLANHYLTHQAAKMDAGDISVRHVEDCRRILGDFAKAIGKQRVISDLRPEDFGAYRTRLAKKLGVHALTRTITVVKGAFKHATEAGLIDAAPRFAPVFKKPTAAQVRRAKQKAELTNGKRLFMPADVRSIIEASPNPVLAAVLLGINGGFGNPDCGSLPINAIDFDGSLIEYARPKTGVQQVVPLWPETVDALRIVLESRPAPCSRNAEGLILLTETGRPLVRQAIHHDDDGTIQKATYMDRLGDLCDAVLESLELRRKGIGFYTLRHTFRTWADETKDQHAIHRIMGHAIPGMSGIDVEDIELDRLRAVVDHVRRKVFPDATPT